MDLKQYLEGIRKLEISLYEQNRLGGYLSRKIKNISNDNSVYLKFDNYESLPTFDFGGTLICAMFFAIVGFIIGVIIGFITKSPVGWITLSIGGFILEIIISVVTHNKDSAEIGSRNYYTEQHNNEIEEHNNMQKNIKKQQISILENKLEAGREKYMETQSVLQKLYDIGVIFPKYHGLIPICSFYEYFCSGRCNQLDGHEGAYNIYENEIRQDIIITKLENISSKLDQIQQNQYMLYKAINDCNSNILRLGKTVDMAVNQMKSISQANEIIAYNSEITAQNTEVLKNIETYRLLVQ